MVTNTPLAKTSQMADSRHSETARQSYMTHREDWELGPLMQSIYHEGYNNF